jgi:hypothetical protein
MVLDSWLCKGLHCRCRSSVLLLFGCVVRAAGCPGLRVCESVCGRSIIAGGDLVMPWHAVSGVCCSLRLLLGLGLLVCSCSEHA